MSLNFTIGCPPWRLHNILSLSKLNSDMRQKFSRWFPSFWFKIYGGFTETWSKEVDFQVILVNVTTTSHVNVSTMSTAALFPFAGSLTPQFIPSRIELPCPSDSLYLSPRALTPPLTHTEFGALSPFTLSRKEKKREKNWKRKKAEKVSAKGSVSLLLSIYTTAAIRTNSIREIWTSTLTTSTPFSTL